MLGSVLDGSCIGARASLDLHAVLGENYVLACPPDAGFHLASTGLHDASAAENLVCCDLVSSRC
jgi:hypothetical protein